ncbi:hypothetical protein D1872_264030 [compost metagenome]
MEYWADDEQPQCDHHQQGNERRDDQIQCLWHPLAQEALELRTNESDEERWQHRALIANYLNKTKHRERFGRAVSNTIGIGQSRVNKHQTEHDPKHRTSAKYSERGPSHQCRQKSEGRICQYLREEQKVR